MQRPTTTQHLMLRDAARTAGEAVDRLLALDAVDHKRRGKLALAAYILACIAAEHAAAAQVEYHPSK